MLCMKIQKSSLLVGIQAYEKQVLKKFLEERQNLILRNFQLNVYLNLAIYLTFRFYLHNMKRFLYYYGQKARFEVKNLVLGHYQVYYNNLYDFNQN